MFVVDPRKEKNAIAEAHKLGIPVIAIVDTNCDPEEADYPIPGNDDAIRAVKLIVSTIGNAILEGKQGEQTEDTARKKFHWICWTSNPLDKITDLRKEVYKMAFTAQDVKALREMTGCGMMDCKKALTETDGDQEKAVEYLREKGLSKAAKKAGRIAAEGIVKSYIDNGVGVVVEVNSETDFVAKNVDFQNFVADIAKTIADNAPADVEELKTMTISGGSQTVGDALTEKIATIGENMNIRRFERIATSGVVVDYIHAAGKIGVLVEAEAESSDAVKECLKNVAMQIAALNPKYLSSAEVPEEYKEHEKGNPYG